MKNRVRGHRQRCLETQPLAPDAENQEHPLHMWTKGMVHPLLQINLHACPLGNILVKLSWYLPCCYDKKKYFNKSNLREKVLISVCSSRLQSIVSGNPRPQELETAGHVVSTARKQRKRDVWWVVPPSLSPFI